ncbi:nuclear transcription factor Y subunit B-3-like [Malania oleifera]|uniref:nuclear transcription factor Y subunit B-3-like n=1 Tax=Malania oleifera TaxID=397392 RepID=UPI0025AEC9FA|nr:nuclear transcription factor Y subunit B-3-like [Malania oleifera]XP_057982264.1 nuclear transcription factor Y subunit B-3-like [Malania oleifera]XP_057982268.1 nuclear transcription factor Y subunit B-3-like [Malania oleifera]XP_057982274.1 nuclear transcription factor Y subunit B-3-like [Malania oleifera]XP_057982277.1 nuclear transcription factor Y subunit B-3-like [Malania oleifera]XP_057982279.1 nuclear transcription factor Y subunit B-3-like [Malania oleifera]
MADSDNESGGGAHNSNNTNNNELSPREQDRFLPIANVSRIMKKALPANAKISKDAKETVQECVSEFISFVTGEASDKCQREKRKTINGDDLLWAMTTLGFEDYVEPLKIYLQRFRETEGEKGAVGRTAEKDGGAASSGGSGGVVNSEMYGGMTSSVMMMGHHYHHQQQQQQQQHQHQHQHQHQGHAYGSGAFHQMAVGGGTSGPGKGVSAHPGSGGPVTGRQR